MRFGMIRRRRPVAEGAPAWVVTYGDMMSLMLCLFILIASMSETKKSDKFMEVLESLRTAFGYDPTIGPTPIENLSQNLMLQQLMEVVLPQYRQNKGDSDEIGLRARQVRVSDVREGTQIEIGGRIAFERFSATLAPEAENLLAQLAARIAGHNTVLKVTGHATDEPLPSDSPYNDAWGLSQARARAAGDALERYGIRPERLRLVAAGQYAPLEAHAYDEDTRAANRRVEIVVTEALVDEYKGRPFTGERRE